jgi:predicted ATPase
MRPPWLEKLHVRGFKTFADAAVCLRSCNVLIGGNGAGKSNLLSLLKLLRALARGELQLFVEKAGRANDVLRRATPPTRALEVALDLRTATGKSRYRLLAERTEDDRLLIRSEELEPFGLNGQIRVASHHCQVIVATQSAALVDYFEPGEVIVVHRREGASTLERLSEDRLQDWLKEHTLGQLWEKNVIGGGPSG